MPEFTYLFYKIETKLMWNFLLEEEICTFLRWVGGGEAIFFWRETFRQGNKKKKSRKSPLNAIGTDFDRTLEYKHSYRSLRQQRRKRYQKANRKFGQEKTTPRRGNLPRLTVQVKTDQ